MSQDDGTGPNVGLPKRTWLLLLVLFLAAAAFALLLASGKATPHTGAAAFARMPAAPADSTGES